MSRSIVLRRSRIHGNGVFAAKNLPRQKRLIQYRGRLLRHDEADELHEGGADTGHTFLFTLNEHYVVDANVGGNIARWLNHSCSPNCEALLIESRDGNPAKERIVIETLREIEAGEELTYDYGITLHEPHTKRLKQIWECRCGQSACTGTLLKPKKSARMAPGQTSPLPEPDAGIRSTQADRSLM